MARYTAEFETESELREHLRGQEALRAADELDEATRQVLKHGPEIPDYLVMALEDLRVALNLLGIRE